jgi:formylglycine-generating enzyme
LDLTEQRSSVSHISAIAPLRASAAAVAQMRRFLIPGGFALGLADERPTHRVRVDGFWMDKTVITNAQFQRFVEATDYVTVAERKPDWEELKKQLPPGTPKPAR